MKAFQIILAMMIYYKLTGIKMFMSHMPHKYLTSQIDMRAFSHFFKTHTIKILELDLVTDF